MAKLLPWPAILSLRLQYPGREDDISACLAYACPTFFNDSGKVFGVQTPVLVRTTKLAERLIDDEFFGEKSYSAG